MASRKMTFTVPHELAGRFLKQVPSRERSRYVAEAIAAKLREREERLIQACEIANNDPEVQAIEREWDAWIDHPDELMEPWTSAEG